MVLKNGVYILGGSQKLLWKTHSLLHQTSVCFNKIVFKQHINKSAKFMVQIYNQKSYTKELQMFSMNGILHCLQQTGLGMEECFPLKELRKNSFREEHNHS